MDLQSEISDSFNWKGGAHAPTGRGSLKYILNQYDDLIF